MAGVPGRRAQHSASRGVATAVLFGALTLVLCAAISVPGAYGAFTSSSAVTASYESGALLAPSPLSCAWTSGTELHFDWANNSPALATGTNLLSATTSGGTLTSRGIFTPASATTTVLTDPNIPSPTTTLWYYRAEALRTPGSWTSPDSNEVATNTCVRAIVNVAGDPSLAGGFAGDGGAATSASLNQPRGVAVDSTGNVFIADTANGRVRRVDAVTGIITTIAGTGSGSSTCATTGLATSVKLNNPRGVAVDAAGNVYVTDQGNNVNNRCLRRIDTSGNLTRVAGGGNTTPACNSTGSATASLRLGANPSDVAVDASGNVYVADTGSNCIRRISGGDFHHVAGGGATTACDATTPASTAVQLNAPQGLAVDASGTNVYIADTGNNCVRQVTAGTVTRIAGTGVAGNTSCATSGAASGLLLNTAEGVAVDGDGRVFITTGGGTANRCVRMIVGGTYSQVALTGANSATGDDGPAWTATARVPSSIAIGPTGNVYFADRSNTAGSTRVRMVVGPIP